MGRTNLLPEQRSLLLTWLAAGYAGDAIRDFARKRHWPELPTDRKITYYRKKWADKIADARAARLESAMTEGLAIRAERIARLCEHADQLEKMKWIPDKHGRLHNEKAWRECIDQIAEEMGDKKHDTSFEGHLLIWDQETPDMAGSSPTCDSIPSPA
jgi:hypothetical protein